MVENRELLTRLEQLETHQAFQDVVVEQLNVVVTQHEQEICSLKEKIRLLTEKLRASQPSIMATAAEETPPPHY